LKLKFQISPSNIGRRNYGNACTFASVVQSVSKFDSTNMIYVATNFFR